LTLISWKTKVSKLVSRKGFSLIEVLAAAVLLGSGIVALSSMSNKSVTAVQKNREYELAWDILDRQMAVVDCMGVDAFAEMKELEGQIGDEESGQTVYYWQMDIDYGPYDTVYVVNLSLSWGEMAKEKTIRCSTILNGSSELLEADYSQEDLYQEDAPEEGME
jgi:prepilin-type N-terminal cleavage/methylation domain-containing protein